MLEKKQSKVLRGPGAPINFKLTRAVERCKMGLEEIKTLLEKQTDPALSFEHVANHTATEVKKETDKGITGEKKLRKEAEGLRKFKKGFVDDLGFDPDGGVELRDFTGGLKDKISNGEKSSAGKSDLEKTVNTMNTSLKNLQGQLDKANTQGKEAEKRLGESKIRTKLSKALDPKIFASDAKIDQLIARGAVALGEDGGDGEFHRRRRRNPL